MGFPYKEPETQVGGQLVFQSKFKAFAIEFSSKIK